MGWYVGPNGEGEWADFNHDGIVDEDDVWPMKACYLKATSAHPECARFDFNQSGQVNAIDLSKFISIVSTGVDPLTGVQLRSTLHPVGQSRANWLVPAAAVGAIAVMALIDNK